jgi:hypothetical protein
LAQRVLVAVRKHKAKFYPTPHSLEVLKKSTNGLVDGKLDRDTRIPGCITKTQRLDLLTKALSEYVDDEDAQLGKTDQTVWDVSQLIRVRLMTGASLTSARTTRSLSSPHPPQSGFDMARQERPSYRLPYYEAGLLDYATRRRQGQRAGRISSCFHRFCQLQGCPHS